MAREENTPAANAHTLQLSAVVFGMVEVRRLRRELELLETYFEEQKVRTSGQQQSQLPRTSRTLETLASDNQINLLLPEGRTQLLEFLSYLEQSAPRLHISLASDPSAAFVIKLVGWLRSNIHPFALVQIGRQPTIAAGCIVRTANRSFDFSLRDRFGDQRSQLLTLLDEAGKT